MTARVNFFVLLLLTQCMLSLLKGTVKFGQPVPYLFICFYRNEWWHFQFLQLLRLRVRVHQSFNFFGGPHPDAWGPRTRGSNSETLVIPHSRQEQLDKLKIPRFI